MIKVNLTAKGRDLIEEIFPRHVAAVLQEMGVLTPEEQETLGQLSRKLGLGKEGTSIPMLEFLPDVETGERSDASS